MRQACKDELVAYLSFPSHNIYIALLLCREHCFTKVKIFILYTRSKFRLVEHSTIIRNGKIQHQFSRRMHWKAHFFLNPDTTSPSKETYGFKSTKNSSPTEELKDFEDDMLKMIQSLKFKQVNNPLLNKLKEDTDHIKK